jgi:hypothetical protein
MSASLLHGQEPLRKLTCLRPLGRGNPSPFHCSTPHRPSVKFRLRPTPRCSVQATVGCPASFPRLLPRLLAAIKLYCPLTLLPPPLHLYVAVATPGAAVCRGQGTGRQVLGRVALPLSSHARGRCLGQGVAFPFSCLGSVRWHAHVHRVVALIHPPCQSHLAKEVWTKHHLACPSRSPQATAASRSP